RGAGNILGPEQHGFVSQLGFDLYSKVLSETISEAKDGDIDFDHIGTSGHVDCVLRLPVDARIPESYLLDQTERFALYRRLAILKSPEELETIRDEMRDRFGKLPMEAVNLLEVLRLRQKAMGFGIESISLNTVTDFIEVQFHHTMARDVRWKRIGDMVMHARLRPQPRGFLVPTSGVPEKVMSQVRHILNELEKACKPIAKPIKGAV
ncbi:hypothetical protein KAU08_09815, partial [bacterium]|nr:hypothetical protein [bacterium]